MGSSISQASGIARLTGKRAVALIGDSTFFHSGLPALANAVQADDDVTVVVLDNYVTAMTGFQPSLTTEHRPSTDDPLNRPGDDSACRFSIEETARGLGVREIHSIDPFDVSAALAAMKEAKRGSGVNLVVCHAPCAVHMRRSRAARTATPMHVNQDLCNACSLCVRMVGCPGISVTGGEYSIDQTLCVGCALCARVCQNDAIESAVPERTA
jgi:indolepyruvate ferredoxin oxidoreductase alpha subunit